MENEKVKTQSHRCDTTRRQMCYSGREMVAKPAGNLWQADIHPTATREHQSGNRVICEDIEISESKYKLNKKHIKYLHNSK